MLPHQPSGAKNPFIINPSQDPHYPFTDYSCLLWRKYWVISSVIKIDRYFKFWIICKYPFYLVFRVLHTISLTSSMVTSVWASKVRSNAETLGVGTRIAVPSRRPLSSSITSPIALAEPVEVGLLTWLLYVRDLYRSVVDLELADLQHWVNSCHHSKINSKIVIKNFLNWCKTFCRTGTVWNDSVTLY